MTAPDHVSSNAQRRVLIVDDLEDNRELLLRYLKSSGFSAHACPSGPSALAALSTEAFDMVLLDWMMPQFSGLDTLQAIRERYDRDTLPVIMCTAIGEDEAIAQALAAGANDHVVKPINFAVLAARMDVHLQHSASIAGLKGENERVRSGLAEKTKALFELSRPGEQARTDPESDRGGGGAAA